MKIFFASLDDFAIEVDAWVPTLEQGLILLKALHLKYEGHSHMMRARLRKYNDYEERVIYPVGNADDFFRRVELMGQDEPTS